jgi:hypothetical protein
MGTLLLVAGSIWISLSAIFIVSLALAARGGIKDQNKSEVLYLEGDEETHTGEALVPHMAQHNRIPR